MCRERCRGGPRARGLPGGGERPSARWAWRAGCSTAGPTLARERLLDARRARALDPDPVARPRWRRHRGARAIPRLALLRRAREPATRAPSSSARAPARRRRRRSPPWPIRMRGGAPRTRRSAARARTSAPRSAHRAAEGRAASRRDTPRRAAPRCVGRRRIDSGRAGPALPPTVRPAPRRLCVSSVKRRGRLPPAVRGRRCRTTARARARCRRPRAGRATG